MLPVSGSTSTSQTCVPLGKVSCFGEKVACSNRPGSMPAGREGWAKIGRPTAVSGPPPAHEGAGGLGAFKKVGRDALALGDHLARREPQRAAADRRRARARAARA